MTLPTCRLVCSDQLAALALSPTTRLLSTTRCAPPTGGSGAWVQFSRPWNAGSRPALLTMPAGTWLPLVMVVLFATVTPLPEPVLGGFWKKLFCTSVGSLVVVAPGAKLWWTLPHALAAPVEYTPLPRIDSKVQPLSV